jgi:hypothetical protein
LTTIKSTISETQADSDLPDYVTFMDGLETHGSQELTTIDVVRNGLQVLRRRIGSENYHIAETVQTVRAEFPDFTVMSPVHAGKSFS